MTTEKVYLKDVSYKHAQLLWVEKTDFAYGLGQRWAAVICNDYIKMDSKTYETYHALHENILAPSFSHIH